MRSYYDSGVILKLYTLEEESPAVRAFVTGRGEPLYLNSLHLSECASALKLKCFRRESTEDEVNAALADIEADIRAGVIRITACDWDEIWRQCRFLAETHTAATGCRTMDTLHIACARHLVFRELISTDQRQIALARAVGLKVTTPFAKKGGKA